VTKGASQPRPSRCAARQAAPATRIHRAWACRSLLMGSGFSARA
jgi:hypothetical protein